MSTKRLPTWIGRVRELHVDGLFEPMPTATYNNEDWHIDFGGNSKSTSLTSGDIVEVDEQNAQITRLAKTGSCADRIYTLLAQFKINPIHSPETLSEAENLLQSELDPKSQLTDLTKQPFVTIDNEDSKDLDQALLVQPAANDGFEIYYALADASWFVQPGSSLFSDALERCVTYYTPLINAPMLPRVLSENLVSLNPEVIRRALTFKITLDSNGRVTDRSVFRAKIRSYAKLTYIGVQAYYDALATDDHHPYDDTDYGPSLVALQRAGNLLLQNSRDRDVVELDRREPTITIADAASDSFTIKIRDRLDSERYNEQISLLCNTEGAKLLDELGSSGPEIQSIFRVHLPPLNQRMKRLSIQINALVDAHSLDERWRWRRSTSIADYVSALPHDSKFARIRQSIERLVMMTNRASSYKELSDQHHALKVDSYARFSSPMREMVGIFTHKELCEALGFTARKNTAEDEQLRQAIITGANRAKSIQRSLEKAFSLEAIRDYLDRDLTLDPEQRPWRSATVIGISKSKIFINIDGFALDLKLYRSDIETQNNCKYRIDEVSARPSIDTAPTFILGNGLTIRTQTWSTHTHRYLFDIAMSTVESEL